MSGFSPFGLSTLGSMSTLGNLASAQRLDHLNDLLSRNQNSNWNRDKPRRSLDDDYFGGGGVGGGNRNRRSLSPPRVSIKRRKLGLFNFFSLPVLHSSSWIHLFYLHT